MRFLRKVGRWAVILYLAQALVGIGVGIYLVVTLDSAEIERMVSCVTR
jgi:hypothetical protein